MFTRGPRGGARALRGRHVRGTSLDSASRRREFHQKIANIDLAILVASDNGKSAAFQDDYGREQACRSLRQQVKVEAEEQLACVNVTPFLHMQLEAFTCETHGVDPYV